MGTSLKSKQGVKAMDNNEKAKKIRVSSYLPASVSDKVTKYAKAWGVSKSDFIAVALGQYLDQIEKSYMLSLQLVQEYYSQDLKDKGINISDGKFTDVMLNSIMSETFHKALSSGNEAEDDTKK